MTHDTTGAALAIRNRSSLAAGYADRGWYVLPTSGKRPTIKDWDRECSVDPDEVRAAWRRGGDWHGLNIAIACGRSGLVVIDIDRKDGRDGFVELEKLGIELPETYSVKTPTGGLHLYYLAPRGIVIGSGANVLAPGVDVRADRGIVVAAGSVLDTGEYRLISDLPVAPLPARLIDALAGKATPLEERRAARIPEAIPQGERDQILTSLAGSMRRRGASAGAILAALQVENTERCVPPMPDSDLERIAESVGRYDPAGATPTAIDTIEVDPDLLQKQLVTLETMRVANDLMKTRAMRRQREVLGGMSDPMNVLDFVAAGPDPVATCIWGNRIKDGMMAWAENQGVIICGPPGTGKSTIALQVILRRVGILKGDVLGLPVVVSEQNLVYLALDRADQIRQSIRRMVPATADTAAIQRLLMIDNIPPDVDLREVSTWIAWLKRLEAGGVVIDSAKDLGFDLNDSSEGQAFNFLVQATLRAGIQIMVTHHSRKTPRGDKKPLTLNDMHGSQWVAAGAGSVLMLDGEAGPKPKRLVHVKPLTVPMPPLLLELDTATGEVSHREDDEDRDDDGNFKARTGTMQDRILEFLATQREPISGEAIARELGANSGSVSKSCAALAGKQMIMKTGGGWTTARPTRAAG